MAFGKLGARGGFGGLGALRGAAAAVISFFYSLNFSDARNSQYLTIGMI